MGEHAWHKKVREEIFSSQQPNKAYTSHSVVSILELFRVGTGERLSRKGCLSDADIVVFNGNSEKITKIIEIESALNPKKIMGIVLATHLCNFCRILKKDYELDDVRLDIAFKKAPQRSKKDLKLTIFEPILQDFIKHTKGCISELVFSPQD
jgi:hypothetical protein